MHTCASVLFNKGTIAKKGYSPSEKNYKRIFWSQKTKNSSLGKNQTFQKILLSQDQQKSILTKYYSLSNQGMYDNYSF